MKWLSLILILSGCTKTIISTNGPILTKKYHGAKVHCATINEWDVSLIRADKGSVGCWCQFQFNLPGMLESYIFQLSKDEMCKDGLVPETTTP